MGKFWMWAICSFLAVWLFGVWTAVTLLFSFLACIIGCLVVAYYSQRNLQTKNQQFFPHQNRPVQSAIFTQMFLSSSIQHKHDRRLTGATIIDEQLQEVIMFAFRDFIYSWYHHISPNDDFPFHIRDTVQKVIIACACRSKEVDWVHYVTTRLVDDFASHLRLYRKAQIKLKEAKISGDTIDLQTAFFENEKAMEKNLCRHLVCTSRSHETAYLQDLMEVLLYLVLPTEDFQNKSLRFLLREVLVNNVMLPLVDLMADPDYINQTLIWLCKDSLLTPEGFMMVLRCTDSIEELQAIRELVVHELAMLRSKDTGGDFDAEIKQQLSSLIYVKKVIDSRLRRLQEGNCDSDSTGLPTEIDWRRLTEPGVRLFALPFEVVLTNNIALHHFIEFMTAKNAQGYVFFYHAVEGFKVSAEQQLSQTHQLQEQGKPPLDLESLRDAAKHIYELFLTDKASLFVKLEEALLNKLHTRIFTERPSECWFDEAQTRVYETMQEDTYFGVFKRSSDYIRLLAELDLLKDSGGRSDEEDISFGSKSGVRCPSDDGSLFDTSSLSSLEQEDELGLDLGSKISSHDDIEEFGTLAAHIYNTGIVHESGSQYAVYAISVTLHRPSGAVEKWCIVRRYSDFHALNMAITEKHNHLSHLSFPGKKTFNNLSRSFLEKRTENLNSYLQKIIACDELQLMLAKFLDPGPYEKSQGMSKTMSNMLVSPLKQSMKNVRTRVRAMPDTLLDGLKDGLVKVLGNKLAPSQALASSQKVAAGLDIEGDDNIPLRIMLLLMDEVFDLKSKDQWFRRRIVVLLRQIIKATFGDTINRKIVDQVGFMTSAEQVAEYVKAFRASLWPNGSQALPQSERDQPTRMRTRVATKMVLLCSLPDELKHVIGSETTRKGMLCIFEMFQQAELNRRLLYVLLEGILEVLFPDNYLNELFRRLHSPKQANRS